MCYYKGGKLAGVSPISSGREGHGTRPGNFSVTQKDKDHKSTLFGDYVAKDGTLLKGQIDVRKDRRPPGAIFDAAVMPFFMRFDGAVGMHEGFLPGYPDSHGCIRLTTHDGGDLLQRDSGRHTGRSDALMAHATVQIVTPCLSEASLSGRLGMNSWPR